MWRVKNVSRSCGGQNSAWRWDSVRSLSPPHGRAAFDLACSWSHLWTTLLGCTHRCTVCFCIMWYLYNVACISTGFILCKLFYFLTAVKTHVTSVFVMLKWYLNCISWALHLAAGPFLLSSDLMLGYSHWCAALPREKLKRAFAVQSLRTLSQIYLVPRVRLIAYPRGSLKKKPCYC